MRHKVRCRCEDCLKIQGIMLLEYMLIHNPKLAQEWIKNVWESYEEHGNGD